LLGAGFVDVLTDGHLHSVCTGSGGGGGDPHCAEDGGGRGSRGGGSGGSSPNVLTPSPPPLAVESAWSLAAAEVAGRAGLGTALVALPETVRRRCRAGGGGAWSCMSRQLRACCVRWSRRRRPWELRGCGGSRRAGEAARPWRRLRPRERGGGGAEAHAGGRAAAAQLSAPARVLQLCAAVQRPRGGGKWDWCADGGQRRRFLGSCSRVEGTTGRRGLKPVYIIYILETHKISESVAWMKDTGC
jgi:hypothetical protein